MQTIIAPTNFSATSINAVNYAADMAMNTGSSLILLHVIPLPEPFDVPVTQYQYESMLENAEQQLDMLKNQLLVRTNNNIEISTKAALSTMGVELLEVSDEAHPFIIVIGPERETGVERFLFGSHTFNIAETLPCPVAVIPENAVFRHIKRIGLATDLKDIENIPVEAIGAMVELFGAGLDIIYVCANAEQKANSEKSIAEISEKLKEFEPTFHFEMNDSLANGINAYAQRNKEDMIIVLPKKYSFFQSIFHRSGAKTISLKPAVPIAAIPG